MLSIIMRLIINIVLFVPRLVVGRILAFVTGKRAIIELDVEAISESMERQKMFLTLRAAGEDPRVVAIVLRLKEAPGGWATVQDLGDVIRTVRDSGTPVYAFLEQGGNALAWLAAQCDHVVMVPTGELSLLGLGTEMMFYGAALEKLGVQPDFEAAGEFKSFGEPFLRAFPSRANRMATQALLDSMHTQLVDGIAVGRSSDPKVIHKLMEQGPLFAEQAEAKGLIDQLMYEDQFADWLEEQHGDRSRSIPFGRWAFFWRIQQWLSRMGKKKKMVAVVHLEGPIVLEPGNSSPCIQGRKVAKTLRNLRESEHISAVVLNVNSPGGSALASDLMWREVEQMAQQKPVVAVFDDVAASGGYYLAAPAAEIIARKGTLTGSIGVFGGKLVLGKAIRNVGVHTHPFLTARNANYFSPFQRFTDEQRIQFKASLQRFYDGFVHRVASGRRRPVEEIEVHCRGRVWTGRDALECGLVDRIGDLNDGLRRACELAGVRFDAVQRIDVATERRSRLLNKIRSRIDPFSRVERFPGFAQSRPLLHFVELMHRHEGQIMAMLPFTVRPK